MSPSTSVVRDILYIYPAVDTSLNVLFHCLKLLLNIIQLIISVDSDQIRHGPTAGFLHEGKTAHPEHKAPMIPFGARQS